MSDEPLDSATEWVAEHTRKYVESDGEDGYMWRGYPTVVLTTTGRKSGALRRNALIFGRDGDDYILVASYGGRPQNPLWYRNLTRRPVGDDPRPRRDRRGSGRDRGRGGGTGSAVGADGGHLSAVRRVSGQDGTTHPDRSCSAGERVALRQRRDDLAGEHAHRSMRVDRAHAGVTHL